MVVWPCRTSTTVTGCSSSKRTPAPDGRGARDPAGSAGEVVSGSAASLTIAVWRARVRRATCASALGGLGKPDEDPPALLAPDHLVRGCLDDRLDVERVELEPAALAATAPERARALAAQLGAQLLVERDQPGVEPVDGLRALGAHRLGVGVERDVRRVALRLDRGALAGQRLVRRGHLGERGLVRLEPFHDVELDLLELRLPTPEGAQLALQRLEVLGAPLPRVEPGLVARGAHPHLLDVGLGLGQLTPQVAHRRLGRHERRVQVGDLRVQLDQTSELRQGALLVGDLVQAGVELLDLEQSALVRCGCCRHGCPSVEAWGAAGSGLATRPVHGSVRSVLTRVSTVVPAAATSCSSARAAWASQGHSDAKCATSTRYGVGARSNSARSRSSEAGWWRRS